MQQSIQVSSQIAHLMQNVLLRQYERQKESIKVINKPLQYIVYISYKIEINSDFQEYVEYLIKNGLKINNLRLAQFRTKNNLPYLGLQAIDKINNNEILVSVPKELMLTTKIAYFSEIQEIFDAFPQFYSQHYSGGWQDRILLTYILYQSQLGRKSQWYHLIQNLPRDIDFLSFWSAEELSLLDDESLVHTVGKELKEFQLIADSLNYILDQYPQYFKKETYSYDNIKWIFVHLVSRCFGSTLAQVAFVPFCEMFNHENTNVRYEGQYLENNIHKNEVKQIEENESDESDGDSNEYDEDDYQYPQEILDQISTYKKQTPTYKLIEEELKIFQNHVDFSNPEQVKDLRRFEEKCNNRIELQIQYLQHKRWFQENLNLRDNFTIIFVSKSLEHILEYIKMHDEDILTMVQVQEILSKVTNCSEQYLHFIQQYSLQVLKNKNYYLSQFDLPEQQSTPKVADLMQSQLPQNTKHFESKEDWKEDQFDNFIIKCSTKDEFQKDAQVYFCYGTISNRALLLRYGFALEYNIYDYVLLKQQYIETIPFASDIAQYFKLSKCMKFKIKYNRINEDLLMYFRLQSWNYEQGVEHLFNRDYSSEIDHAKAFIRFFLNLHFKQSLQEEMNKLNDQKLRYHEYFAQVYKVERQRILEAQLEALELFQQKIETKFQWTNNLVDKFCNQTLQEVKN